MVENMRAKRQATEFDPDFGTASAAVDPLRRGEISALELTSHVFARIERHNPRLNLFVTLAQEQAMERARAADEAQANGRSWGALHGLPIVVKDVFATAGVRTTAGSKQLESYTPTENAAAVDRLVAAGAIVVGKTNLPEFAGDWQSSNAVAGTSNNPWAELRDYRIGYVIDDPFCPVDSEVAAVLSRAIGALREGGARMQEGWPAGVDPARQYECYGSLLGAFLSQSLPDAAFEGMRQAAAAGVSDPWVRGVTATHREWLRQSAFRLQSRAIWQEWFASSDAFLMPVAIVPAFPHDHRDMGQRTLTTSGGERPYTDLGKWVSFATLTGCPATTVPVGFTSGGLPVGLQILGPVYEDATPIDVARKMAGLIGGFVPPPALRGEDS